MIYPVYHFSLHTSLCKFNAFLPFLFFSCVSVNCPPGTRGARKGTSPACLPCPAGTYQPDQGQTSCVPCPAGSSSDRKGLENLSSCKGETRHLFDSGTFCVIFVKPHISQCNQLRSKSQFLLTKRQVVNDRYPKPGVFRMSYPCRDSIPS